MFIFTISLFHLHTQAYLADFPSTGPISPYIGSIPALVNAKTYDQILQEIIGPPTNYSNGFFWPPPRALVAKILEKNILQSSGLAGLGLESLELSGMGLGLSNMNPIGLLENLQRAFARGVQVIQIPLSSSSSTLPQCQAPCFVCSPQTYTPDCTQSTDQQMVVFTTTQTSISLSNLCCCCIQMSK
ncbi:hypothetical protein ACH3XW_6685 [Acanthocheilonema viteae]